MSHLHFPDGLLPLWLIIAGFAVTALVMAVSLKKLKEDSDFVRKVSFLAILSALMLVAMSIPLGFIHYHINLTVLVSLLLGPWISFIGVFVVNFFLSFIGHGGFTVVGLNTLVVGSEVFLAYYIFFGLRRFLKTLPAVFLTTILTLFISSLIMVSIVAAAGLSPAVLEDSHHHCDHDHDHDEDCDDHSHDHAHDEHCDDDHDHDEDCDDEHDHDEHCDDDHDHDDESHHVHAPHNGGGLGGYLRAYAKFLLPLLLMGSLIEAAVTGGIVRYLGKVKPDLVEDLFKDREDSRITEG